MKASVVDQVYEGMEAENKLVDRAIDATNGSVIMYQDDFVQAYYHSTCGGLTDGISSVWDRPELPYLKPVSDDGACSWSKYFRWEETYTEPQLRLMVEQYLSTERGRDIKIGKIVDVAAMERTPGGRVARLMVRTEIDVHNFYKDRIRWVLRRASNPDLILASDKFDVKLSRDPQGNLLRSYAGRQWLWPRRGDVPVRRDRFVATGVDIRANPDPLLCRQRGKKALLTSAAFYCFADSNDLAFNRCVESSVP